MNPKLLTAANHETMLNLDCNCEVCILNTLEGVIAKKCGRPNKIAPINVWFVRRIYRIRRSYKFGHHWVECRDLIDNMDHPSNMEIGLCIEKEPTTSGLTILRII